MNQELGLKRFEGSLLKLLSLVTAAFLWFYVVNSEPITVEKTYEISVITPAELAVDSISHQKVKVILKGARSFLKEYHHNDYHLEIDLTKKKINRKDTFKYSISDRDLSLPFGIDVVQMKPERIELTFDRKINKSIPIKVQTSQNLPPDLKMVSFKLNPSKVFIEGPVSAMKKIGQTKTHMIDVGHLSGRGEIEVHLAPLPEFIQYKEEDLELKLSYDIRPKNANVRLQNIPIHFVSTSQKFRVNQRTVALEVLATDEIKITKDDVKIYAEIPNSRGSHIVQLKAQLPDGVHLLKITPQSITVKK